MPNRESERGPDFIPLSTSFPAPRSRLGDEVVEDFLSHQEGITDRHQSPKKAALGLGSGDMTARHAVISRQQLEQDRIDDIYFTSEYTPIAEIVRFPGLKKISE